MSEWDEYADGWDDDPVARAYAAAAWESLLRLASRIGIELDGATVCDFGCGTGLLTERLAPVAARVDAVDLSEAMRAVLAEKTAQHGWEHVAVLDRLPAALTGGYGLVVASSVLAFVDDHPATVAALAERLASGGLLVHWDWEADPDDPDGGGLSVEAARAALEGAGLVEISVGTGFEVPFEGEVMRPLMAAARRP
ncbi:methyltransferase family protein [Ilumatobacter fluminis]|uniref:Methyltransferase family protein n=1 Tax=Ilumatobacter fluminis TaxID=467091 RepID=A0A4R7I1B4_9ACTN|nr:methyltransferase family protein [Ilumatobacter fluminis]